ncbi:cytochrome P450 6a2-like [Zophobas morio]|uniref:cytochrome P450 6a2-like n=1 Tax=Zophobas morio TaxID=2755281 RepID=UPI003083A698
MKYWNKKQLPNLQPQIPFGNCPNFAKGKENLGVELAHLYAQIKKEGWKHSENDFEHFCDRMVGGNPKTEPLHAHLLNLKGTQWRDMRTKLRPSFTAGKTKMMFDIIKQCQDCLVKKVENLGSVEVVELCKNFTTDVIGSCAFGLDCKSMENEISPFKIYGRRALPTTTLSRLKLTFFSNFPRLGSFLNIRTIDKDVHDFFMNLAHEVIEYREKNGNTRHDFIQSLIEIKKSGSLTVEDIAAQTFVFFLAGFETSALLMTWTLYELAKNLEIQERLRDEICDVLEKFDGKISYQSLQEMKYFDQVMNETMRKFPPVPFVNRVCTKDYKMPNEDTIIEKGTAVVIPILGIHRDADYYPDPEKFDPARFSEENKKKMHSCAYIPFGKGPRSCIGMRLGLLQAKVGLCGLVRNFRFTLNEKTPDVMGLNPGSLFSSPVEEIWLNVEKCL